MELGALADNAVVRGAAVDVVRQREATRQRRITRVAWFLVPFVVYLWHRVLINEPLHFGWPHLTETEINLLPLVLLIVILGPLLVMPVMLAGRSPHQRFQPSEIDVGFDDVVGLGVVKDEVLKTLNLFLTYQTFRDTMGGNPRKAILFEGPPGTGKTYMAKAMAREAGVPYLFVSSSAFQSMYYGQTNRKIRSYFRALRKAAREEGGAIGFIEEIDAIAGARSGMRAEPLPPGLARSVERAAGEGISGVVNELLIQLQSFEHATAGGRVQGWLIEKVNRFLPVHRQLQKKPAVQPNVLVIGATNRAADLDPALLRPGRFDRSIHFDLPSRSGRREIIDYYLSKKAHDPVLDKPERRDQLAAMTFGYTPVMIEHLFDEGLIWALREGRESMNWDDVAQAKMTEEIGLKQPVEYDELEKRTIATHEAGHAVVAHLIGLDRKLEVLSIIKRRDALGLLAHSDTSERFTRRRSELIGVMQIAFGGMTAEELWFGEAGTGPSSDLHHATTIAAQMVGSFGMAGSLVSFEAMENGPINAGIVAKVLNNDDGRSAVSKMLEQAKADTTKLLDEHRYMVEALRDELLAREELIGDEITDVLREAEARHSLATPVEGAAQ
ncbi:MAG TPA: AAA family ATPase [Acidimicrobiia bacterium]|nr:AAA family ATPase [Acidimicrobiia bacterium]